MGNLSLKGVTKKFGKVTAVDDLTLDVADGELALDVQAEPEKLLPAVVE